MLDFWSFCLCQKAAIPARPACFLSPKKTRRILFNDPDSETLVRVLVFSSVNVRNRGVRVCQVSCERSLLIRAQATDNFNQVSSGLRHIRIDATESTCQRILKSYCVFSLNVFNDVSLKYL